MAQVLKSPNKIISPVILNLFQNLIFLDAETSSA